MDFNTLSDKNGNKKYAIWIYMQCYFVTIATILGTGVLGLPITLSHSGIYPFLVTFIIGFLVQALLIYFMTDLLQRAYAVQWEAIKEYGREESVPLYAIMDEDSFEEDVAIDVQASDGSVLKDIAGHVILPPEETIKSPNLYMLADFFLARGVKQIFHLCLILTFLSLLVSYALAGSQSYAQLIRTESTYIIPVFVWVLAFSIVFALRFIQPVVSFMTFIKGSLLLVSVFVTFVPGSQVANDIYNDFRHIGQPFLMGTVALGGVFQTMPLLYSKIKQTTSQLRNYRRAIVGGLTTCAILNILWCWAVLEIVPQTSSSCNSAIINDTHVVSSQMTTSCIFNISLERAGLLGQISTVPLTQILSYYPKYAWVAIVLEVFIVISITVSYLTIGSALSHTLRGWIDNIWSEDRFAVYQEKLTFKSCRFNIQSLSSSILTLLVFSIVFVIAILNPKGFESVLEKFASFMLNLHSGVFIFLMIRKATSIDGFGYLKIPLKLPDRALYLMYILPAYFGFALGYDIYTLAKHSGT